MDSEQEQAKQHLLRIIEGGKTPPAEGKAKVKSGPVGKAESGLTLKQEEFAQQLAKGATNSEAYRAAYNADGMAAATVHQEGCRLAQHPQITARVSELLSQKAQQNQRAAVKASERVNAKAWAMIEDPDTPPAVVANLLNLQAKINGMLTDKVEVSSTSSSRDIEAELIERLKQYTSR